MTPCPFTKSHHQPEIPPALMEFRGRNCKTRYRVVCRVAYCSAEGPVRYTPDAARRAWNQRAAPAPANLALATDPSEEPSGFLGKDFDSPLLAPIGAGLLLLAALLLFVLCR